jgi:hypothetical protein
MATSSLTALADAIVTALKAETWDVPIAPEAKLAPLVQLTDTELHVVVIQVGDSLTKAGVSPDGVAVEGEYTVDVVVQRKFASGEEVDAEGLVLVELCAAMGEFLLAQRLNLGNYHAACNSVARDEVLSLADFLVEREFFAVLSTKWEARYW